MTENICIVYTHHKLGDLIWQLPYVKAISNHHNQKIDLVVRKKTQAKNILKDIKHINLINYNDFRKGIFYWIDVSKLIKIFLSNKYVIILFLISLRPWLESPLKSAIFSKKLSGKEKL